MGAGAPGDGLPFRGHHLGGGDHALVGAGQPEPAGSGGLASGRAHRGGLALLPPGGVVTGFRRRGGDHPQGEPVVGRGEVVVPVTGRHDQAPVPEGDQPFQVAGLAHQAVGVPGHHPGRGPGLHPGHQLLPAGPLGPQAPRGAAVVAQDLTQACPAALDLAQGVLDLPIDLLRLARLRVDRDPPVHVQDRSRPELRIMVTAA